MAVKIQKASFEKSFLRVLFYGASKTGKTLTAIREFPNLLMIDIEGKANLYANEADFDIAAVSTTDEVIEALDIARKTRKWQWVCIDSLTALSMIQRAAAARGGDMNTQSWAKANNQMRRVFAAVNSLPAHTIMIAHIAPLYKENSGAALEVIGDKPDVHKSVNHVADISFVFEQGGVRLESMRNIPFGDGNKQWKQLTYNLFKPAVEWASSSEKTETFSQLSDDEILMREEASMAATSQDRLEAGRRALVDSLSSQGYYKDRAEVAAAIVALGLRYTIEEHDMIESALIEYARKKNNGK